MFSFFMLKVEGIFPLVSERDIAVDQTKSPLDWVYHLLVNSVVIVPVFVEFGRITKSLSPYSHTRYHAGTQLYEVKFPPTKSFPSHCIARA